MTLKGHAKIKGKLIHGLENDIKNLVSFHGFLLSKAFKVSDEKIQKSYDSSHWRTMQSVKRNWLLVPKITWGIW